MKLSEAIRLGSMLKPQAIGSLRRSAIDQRVHGDILGLRRVPAGTCAWGAALDAIGDLQTVVVGQIVVMSTDDFMITAGPVENRFPAQFPIACLTASCPVCGDAFFSADSVFTGVKPVLGTVIVHLNDYHLWAREQIAEWVATAEAQHEQRQQEVSVEAST